MSKTLTRADREDKGDVDLSASVQADCLGQRRFPSYFSDFCRFKRLPALLIHSTPRKRRSNRKSGIPHAAAIMAIV
jgi:hypothetical protein